MEDDEILEIELEGESTSDEDYTTNYVAPPPEYIVQSRKNAEELADLRARQAKQDQERLEQENARILYSFEQRFPNVGDEEKAFIKGFMQINNQILERQLAERDARLEALSKKIYETELHTDNLKSFINNVDYRTTMHEICDIALKEKFKGKLKNGVTLAERDFALSEYELRLQNDEKFALKVKSITSDPKLKPSQMKSRLAQLVSDNFVKAYVDKYQKTGKRTVEVQIADTTKDSGKKSNEAKKAPEPSEDAPPLTPEQYKAMTQRLLKNI